MKESHIQQQICELLSKAGVFYFSIPNERWGISHAQRTSLKKMGLTPGMPDLCIIHDGRPYFLEVKTDIGGLSEGQERMIKILLLKGVKVSVVRSLSEAEKILKTWKVLR